MGYKNRKLYFERAVLAAAIVLAGCNNKAEHAEHTAAGLSSKTRDGRLSPLLRNLGKYNRQTSAKTEDAARYFNQGLVLVYGFNHAEALRSFEEAARVEPLWGMAYWGQALALAPNINDSAIGPDREKQGYQAIQNALARKSGLSAVELALVEALAARFVGGDKVVVGSDDGRLYLVSLNDGKELWSYELGQSIDSSPAVASGKIVIGCDDGSVYCFGEKR